MEKILVKSKVEKKRYESKRRAINYERLKTAESLEGESVKS